MMKWRWLPLVLCVMLPMTMRALGPDKPSPDVVARLDAMQKQLDRIEELLQKSAFSQNQPSVEAGRVQVSILGQVNVPGVYNVEPNAPIGVLIAMAHGGTRIANLGNVSVVPKKGKPFKVDARKSAQTYKVKSGDIVTVGEAYY